MSDILRLPDETTAMTFLYLNTYKRFHLTPETQSPLLDAHTLALASLSLASKATEAPRRLREFLLPAWRLLQSNNPSAEPLTFPSVLYDTLRATVVQAELILLRVLKFELRIALPFEFLPRYLDRTVGEVNAGGGGWGGTEDYDGFDKERRDEYKVVDLMDTGIGRAARAKIVDACKNYQLAIFYPARAIAAACLYVAFNERGLHVTEDMSRWLEEVTSGRVDRADFDEILVELAKT
ncbi:MAG: hypothetical protein M1830_009257 [Pleopsidium flavum]|nr:MAG: hypothetical protein M1830_009257 [Pleopsidium flavum]